MSMNNIDYDVSHICLSTKRELQKNKLSIWSLENCKIVTNESCFTVDIYQQNSKELWLILFLTQYIYNRSVWGRCHDSVSFMIIIWHCRV